MGGLKNKSKPVPGTRGGGGGRAGRREQGRVFRDELVSPKEEIKIAHGC